MIKEAMISEKQGEVTELRVQLLVAEGEMVEDKARQERIAELTDEIREAQEFSEMVREEANTLLTDRDAGQAEGDARQTEMMIGQERIRDLKRKAEQGAGALAAVQPRIKANNGRWTRVSVVAYRVRRQPNDCGMT